MTKTIVISQSMYFPWVGLLEQIRLADKFVHYDDVQFARGFFNRVQIKDTNGTSWISVPLKRHSQKTFIRDVEIDNSVDWRSKHRKVLEHSYRKAPFFDDMLRLVDSVFDLKIDSLSELSMQSMLGLVDYFGIRAPSFIRSEDLGIPGSGSERILEIVRHLGGDVYVTGHGASNYLDHDLFVKYGVDVRYMDYLRKPYLQLHGAFTPYVSALDLVANHGADGAKFICSDSISWKVFNDVTRS